ncbi:MAG: hypothetical protein ACK5OS_09730, partial [Chryseotalea sp.]
DLFVYIYPAAYFYNLCETDLFHSDNLSYKGRYSSSVGVIVISWVFHRVKFTSLNLSGQLTGSVMLLQWAHMSGG